MLLDPIIKKKNQKPQNVNRRIPAGGKTQTARVTHVAHMHARWEEMGPSLFILK